MSKYFKVYVLPSLLILALSVSFLFFIKNEVTNLNRELKIVNAKILESKEAMHILKAEYSYLTSPKRIKTLADKNLNLVIPKKEQIFDKESFKISLKNKPINSQEQQEQ